MYMAIKQLILIISVVIITVIVGGAEKDNRSS